MELKQLGMEYRSSARACRERAAQLRLGLSREQQTPSDCIALRRRISMLEEMARQASAIGRYLINYYGEEVFKDGTDTDLGISELTRLLKEAGPLGQPASPNAGRGHRAGADAAPGADGAHVLFGAALDAGDGLNTGRLSLDGEPHSGRRAKKAAPLPALRRKDPA